MILNVFDFDDTLFRIPSHTSAPFDFPMNGNIHTWYDHPDSLDFTKYRIDLIETVADEMKLEGSESIIITRRIQKMIHPIISLLKLHGILPKSILTIGHDRNKPEAVDEYLYEGIFEMGLEKPTKIRIFEDSMYQVQDYMRYFSQSRAREIIEYFFVDKTHLIKIDALGTNVISKLKLKIG